MSVKSCYKNKKTAKLKLIDNCTYAILLPFFVYYWAFSEIPQTNRRVRPHKSPSLIMDPKKMKLCNEICFGKELVFLFHAQNDGRNFPMCVLFWLSDYHLLKKDSQKLVANLKKWLKQRVPLRVSSFRNPIFVEMSWNFKMKLPPGILLFKKTHKPWALSTRSSKKTFRTFNVQSWHRTSGTCLKPSTFRPCRHETPYIQWSRRLWSFEIPFKKSRFLTKSTPQLEVWICQKQLLFNAKALSRLPTSRSDVMSTPGSMVFWDRNKTKQHSQRLHNTMLKAVKISIRRKQRSFQGNQNSTTSQPEAEKVARNLRSSSLNL